MKWEIIIFNSDGSHATSRLKVFGGWVVKNFGENECALVFVPDANHEWKI